MLRRGVNRRFGLEALVVGIGSGRFDVGIVADSFLAWMKFSWRMLQESGFIMMLNQQKLRY